MLYGIITWDKEEHIISQYICTYFFFCLKILHEILHFLMGFLKQHICFKKTKKNYGIIGNKVENTYLNNTLLYDFEILGSLGNATKYLKS